MGISINSYFKKKTILTNDTGSNSPSIDISNTGDLLSASMLDNNSVITDMPYWLDHNSHTNVDYDPVTRRSEYSMNNSTHRPDSEVWTPYAPYIVKIDGHNGILVANQKKDVYASPAGVAFDTFRTQNRRVTHLQIIANTYQQASEFMDLKHIEDNAYLKNLLNAAYRVGAKIKNGLVQELLLSANNKNNVLNNVLCSMLDLIKADTDTKFALTNMISRIPATCFKIVYTISDGSDISKTTSFTDKLVSGSRLLKLDSKVDNEPSMMALYELANATKHEQSNRLCKDMTIPLFTSRILHNNTRVDPAFTGNKSFHEAHLLQHLLDKKQQPTSRGLARLV